MVSLDSFCKLFCPRKHAASRWSVHYSDHLFRCSLILFLAECSQCQPHQYAPCEGPKSPNPTVSGSEYIGEFPHFFVELLLNLMSFIDIRDYTIRPDTSLDRKTFSYATKMVHDYLKLEGHRDDPAINSVHRHCLHEQITVAYQKLRIDLSLIKHLLDLYEKTSRRPGKSAT